MKRPTLIAFVLAAPACQLVIGITDRSSTECSASASCGNGSGGVNGPVTGGNAQIGRGGTSARGGSTTQPDAGQVGNEGGDADGAGGADPGGGRGATGGVTGLGGTPTTGGSTAAGGSEDTGGRPTSGGTATTGGTVSCKNYQGTLATPSKIFQDGFGVATSGDWKGYAFPYSWGEGVEITPDRGECFSGDLLCAAATIPADSSSGMGLGWNLNQAEGMDPAGTLVLTAPVRIWLRGALAGMHVGIGLGDVGGDGFCYELSASAAAAANSDAGLVIMLQDFAQRCWDPATAVAYAGSPIRSVFVDYPGTDSASTNVDVCLVDAGPG